MYNTAYKVQTGSLRKGTVPKACVHKGNGMGAGQVDAAREQDGW